MDSWTEEHKEGLLVEMHGDIRRVVCMDCKRKAPIGEDQEAAFRACQPARCAYCQSANVRSAIVLYDDPDSDLITPDGVMDQASDKAWEGGGCTARPLCAVLWAASKDLRSGLSCFPAC